MQLKIVVLPGDGVGPEVIAQAVRVLRADPGLQTPEGEPPERDQFSHGKGPMDLTALREIGHGPGALAWR